MRLRQPGALPWSDDVLAAIEITSSDDDTDFNDKRAGYAAQGIPAYLIVVMDGNNSESCLQHLPVTGEELRMNSS